MEKLIIVQGATLLQPIRWGTAPFVYKAISDIAQSAPCRITAPSHGIPDGWRVEVVSVIGMDALNSSGKKKPTDYHYVTVVDQDTIELNDVDSSTYIEYFSGGYLKFDTPVDLTDYTARMTVKDKIGGTELLSLTTENGGIDLDPTNFLITLQLSATATAAITWLKGVTDLELVKDDVVTRVMNATVLVTREVTTTSP